MKAVEFLIDSHHGSYIPQIFVGFDLAKWHLDPESWEVETCLAGPDADDYHEAWNEIICKAYFELDGNTFELHHDCDLFAICTAMMTDEEKENMGFDI
jgi:hypothetical protein